MLVDKDRHLSVFFFTLLYKMHSAWAKTHADVLLQMKKFRL